MTRGPLRVAHVVGAMNRAGVETWLMNVARGTDPDEVELTFVKHSSKTGHYDAEILRLGHKLAVCDSPRRPLRYARRLRALLRDPHGGFDAVHSHVGNYSAVALVVAWTARIPVRVAHSHSDSRVLQASAPLLRKVYLAGTRLLLRAVATIGLASSREASLSLFRREPTPDGKYRVLPTGIDLEPFAAPGPGPRRELGIGPDALVVGHIGRFAPVKNHEFIVSVADELRRLRPDSRVLLVGDGPLRARIEDEVASRGLSDVVTFLGVREDVPELFATFDVFILPSSYEGVPITLLEAQASGCPALVPAHITSAVDVVPGLIRRQPPNATAADWAATCVALGRAGRSNGAREGALEVFRASDYNIDESLRRLREIWNGGRHSR